MDKDSMQDKLKGKVNQAVGATREKVGDMTGREEMEAKGKAQHAKGDAQETMGKAKGAVSDASNKAKDAVADSADKVKDAVGR